MDVLAVGGEDGASADEAADDGESRLKNRQAEGDDGNRDGNDGGRLLRTVEREGAKEEPNKEAAGIAEEDGRGIEVVAQESKNGSRESDGHHFDQRGTMQERDCEDDHRGEQSGSGG